MPDIGVGMPAFWRYEMSDEYRALWHSLGITMRRHDLLMNALPPIFEKVYLSQSNRPQVMGFCDFVVSQIHGLRVKELVDHKEKGGKVWHVLCLCA